MALNPVATWGSNLIETDIDRLVLVQLRIWLPDYLTRVERERDLPGGLLARPMAESFQNVLEDDEFPDGRLPAILATTARAEDVDKTLDDAGDVRYAAAFRCQVSVVVRGRTPAETREVAAIFSSCVRRILVHQQLDLPGGGEVHWAPGGGIAPVADQSDQGRFLAAGVNHFAVFADEVVSGTGPVQPSDDNPYPDPTPGGDYDPLAVVREGGVHFTVIPRS
jgi:hypothetical protein